MLDGNISKAGYEYYMELRKKLLTSLPVPHVVVYLDASPQVCFDRIHKMRQRVSSSGKLRAWLRRLPLALLTRLWAGTQKLNRHAKTASRWSTWQG